MFIYLFIYSFIHFLHLHVFSTSSDPTPYIVDWITYTRGSQMAARGPNPARQPFMFGPSSVSETI